MIMRDATSLRVLWADDKPAYGTWSSLADPNVAELLGNAGSDFCLADFQHGFFGPSDGPGVIQGYAAAGVAPIVRTPWKDPDQIMRALDLGACGVLIPMVDSAAEAEAAVAAAKYPPRGTRSWGPPLWDARPSVARSTEVANIETLVFVMVETTGAFAELDEILAVPDLDGVYIGPFDFALAHGHGGSTYRDNPELDSMLTSVVDRTRAAGKIAGMYCADETVGADWVARGVRMVNAVSDTAVLAAAMRASLARSREFQPG